MEERKVTAADLRRVKPFAALHQRSLEELSKLGGIKVYQPHDTIYRALEMNTKLLLILRGEVLLDYVFTEHSVPIEILEAGSLWGYTTLLKPGKKYPYRLLNGPRVTEVVELPVAKVLGLAESHADSYGKLIYELAQLQRKRSSARQARVALLFGLSSLMSGSTDARTLLERTLSLLLLSFSATRGLIASFNDHTKQILIEHSDGYKDALTHTRFPLVSETLLSIVYNSGRPLHVTKKNFERKFTSAPYSSTSLVAAPLFEDGAVTGAILLSERTDGAEFTAQDVLTLTAAAPLIASALAQVHRAKTREATTHRSRDFVVPF